MVLRLRRAPLRNLILPMMICATASKAFRLNLNLSPMLSELQGLGEPLEREQP